MNFTLDTDKPVTNQDFLAQVFDGIDPSTECMWVCSFHYDPKKGVGPDSKWTGHRVLAGDRVTESKTNNNYFAVAALHAAADGRKLDHFSRMFCVVLDDPETVPDEIEPTWVIQTSRNSRQVGFKLSEPVSDKEQAKWFVDSLADNGLVPVDRSGNNAGRYVRLPVGRNNKISTYGECYEHELLHWRPEVTHTLEDLRIALKLKAPEGKARAEGKVQGSRSRKPASVFLALQDEIRSGENYHLAAYRLLCHRMANGMTPRASLEELQALMHKSEAPRDSRWQERYDDLPRLVRDAKRLHDKNPKIDAEALFEALIAPGATDVAEGWHIEPFGQEGKPDLSHDALALRLGAAMFTKDARYLPERERWMFWNGAYWDSSRKLYALTAVRDFLRAQANQLTEWAQDAGKANPQEADSIESWAKSQAKQLRQQATVAAVETMARSNAGIAVTLGECDADIDVIGTPGGTVELKTGRLRESRREELITKQTAVAPAPEGEASLLWDSFLMRVMQNDREMVSFLQTLAGYSLTGHTREHRLFFLFGSGSNGKSVFLNTLMGMLGDYAKKAPASTFLQSAGERHPTDLAGLHGARLVVSSELEAGRAWNESIVKDLTGGDTITARFMRQDYFEYTPQFSLIVAGNHQPAIRSVGEAMARRIVLVPFDAHIPESERDESLPDRLKAQWPQIMRWAIDGAVRYYTEGLRVPESVKARSEAYIRIEDTLGEFLSDMTVSVNDGVVGSTELYSSFRIWAERNGAGHQSQKAFTQKLVERGVSHQRRMTGRVFTGLVLKANVPKVDGFGVEGGLAQ